MALRFLEKKLTNPLKTPDLPFTRVIAEKDSDGDGILDSKDKCPDTIGVLMYDGCPVPDTDNDGIKDDVDSCPIIAGTSKYKGCPITDMDYDRINDEEDKCPEKPGVARYDGCPVPDSDKDGVDDDNDKCINEAGVVANKGCPEKNEEVIRKIERAAKQIFFETGSARLLSKSFSSLNEVVAIMKKTL